MHPMFVKLFIETDADDLPPEEDWRRRARRSRRARPAMVVRPAPVAGSTRPGRDRPEAGCRYHQRRPSVEASRLADPRIGGAAGKPVAVEASRRAPWPSWLPGGTNDYA